MGAERTEVLELFRSFGYLCKALQALCFVCSGKLSMRPLIVLRFFVERGGTQVLRRIYYAKSIFSLAR